MANANEKPGRVGLVLMGLFEIFLGVICGLFAVFMLSAGAMIPHSGTTSTASLIPAASMYFFACAQFLTFGIGTLLAKRWARKLMLVLSWFWFAASLCAGLFMLPMMSLFDKGLAAGGSIPASSILMIKIGLGLFLFLIFVAMPGLFILFYGNKKTIAAVEAFDPNPSWTDRSPAPALLLSLLSGMGVLFMLSYMPFYHFVIPFFGLILDGGAGALLCLLITAAMAYIAWGAFQQKASAWWTALATLLFWSVSYLWIFSTQGLQAFYEKMQLPETTMEMMKQSGIFDSSSSFVFALAATCGVYLLYLLWIRKYFK